MLLGNLGLDDGSAHGWMGQAICRNTQRYQTGEASGEAVAVPVSEETAASNSVVLEHGTRVTMQMAREKWQQRLRPADRAVNAGGIGVGEEVDDILVGDAELQMGQPGGIRRPVEDGRRGFLRISGKIDTEGLHAPTVLVAR